MYLRRLKLWNFRQFGSGNTELDLGKADLEVPFEKGVNVLIGENDSGKSTILDAIKLVLDTHSGEWVRLAVEDFYRGAERLRIECRFEELRDEEAMHFTEWLGMDGEGESAKPYLKVFLDASAKGNERLHYDIRAGADDEGDRMTAGARDYLRATYLKPLRDAKAELVPRRNSRLSQILSGHTAFKKGDKMHVLEHVSRCLNCLFQKYFDISYEDPQCRRGDGCPFKGEFYGEVGTMEAGKGIREGIQAMLDEFLGGSEYSADFRVVDRELRSILDQFKLSLSDEELGLGSQNLLFIAAELLNLQRENWSGLRLGLIEELEAHLHPQAQVRVMEYFQNTGEQGEGDEEGEKNELGKHVQLIITTHSPNLGSKVKLKNLMICHGGKVFPMGPAYTKLAESDYRFLERFLDVTKANLFFAKGVILVEGWSEEILLPVLAKMIGVDLTQKGVSIINVGSTAFLRYANIFKRKDGSSMNIPVAVVTDVDVREYEKKPKIESDGKILKDEEGETVYEYLERDKTEVCSQASAKKEQLEKQLKDTKICVAPHWTLEYSLNKSTSLSAQFEKAAKSVHPQIGLDGSFERYNRKLWMDR